MSKVTIKQSRRFASRALAVFNRNKEASAPIKAYEGSLTASAPAVIEKFDRLIALARERREAKERRDEALAELFQTLGSWAGSVRVSIPGFRKADFRATPEVPGDVINAVGQFLGVVEQHEATSGPLPNGEAMKAELEAGLNGLRADTEASEAIEIAYTRARRELREACVLFNEHLVAFRTTIASELGRNDVEYRRLRALPSGKPVEDDLDEVIEDEPDEAEGGGPGEAAAE